MVVEVIVQRRMRRRMVSDPIIVALISASGAVLAAIIAALLGKGRRSEESAERRSAAVTPRTGMPPTQSESRPPSQPRTVLLLDGRSSGQHGDIWDFRAELEVENNLVEGRIRWTLIECPSSLRAWSKRIGEVGFEWVEGSLERQQLVLRTRKVSDTEFLGLNSYTIFFSQGRETFEGTSVSLKYKEKATVQGVVATINQPI